MDIRLFLIGIFFLVSLRAVPVCASAVNEGPTADSITTLYPEDYEIIEEDGTAPYDLSGTMPMFGEGGPALFRKWIIAGIRYPMEAQEKGIEGQVRVSCIVEPNGQVTNIEVISAPDPVLADEVVRVVNSSPLWTPVKSRHKPVRLKIDIPVIFQLRPQDDIAPHDETLPAIPVKDLDKTYTLPEFISDDPEVDDFGKWIVKRIGYPEHPDGTRVEGSASVSFVIGTDGAIEDIIVESSDDPTVSKIFIEALLNCPKGKPGLDPEGNPVRVKYELTLNLPFIKTYPRFRKNKPTLNHFRNWVLDNLDYPLNAAHTDQQGRVVAKFTVDTDGSVQDIIIDSSDNIVFNRAVYETLLKSPKWIPGTDIKGVPVRVKFSLPVAFGLKDAEPIFEYPERSPYPEATRR